MSEPIYEFGTVLQHSLRHETLWLVLTPLRTPSGRTDYYALRLDLESPAGTRQGEVGIIGSATDERTGEANWNVLEVIRA